MDSSPYNVMLRLVNSAGEPIDPNNPLDLPCLGHISIPLNTTAVGIDPEVIPAGASKIEISVEGPILNGIRYRTDGQNPTLTVGHYLESGQTRVISHRSNVLNFKVIGITSATLQVSFY